ncbi:hypothetical protein AAC387_Pa04g1262 [Persea americana]
MGQHKSLFKIVWGMNPTNVVDLIHIPHTRQVRIDVDDLVRHIKSIHDQVRVQIEESNASHKATGDRHHLRVVFDEGDLVWVYLRKDRFPVDADQKLRQQKIRPCRLPKQINDNAYQIELQSDLNIFDVFNITDLSPFYGDDGDGHITRTSFSQVGEDDVDQLCICSSTWSPNRCVKPSLSEKGAQNSPNT